MAILSFLTLSCATGDTPQPDEIDDSDSDLPEQVDPAHVVAEKMAIARNPQVVTMDHFDISPPWRDIAGELDIDLEHESEPLRRVPRPASAAQPSNDRVVQDRPVENGLIPAPLTSFDGLGAGANGFTVSSAPPDPDGDVGPNHYVQIVNSGYVVFSKTGTKLFGPVNSNSLFSGFGGPCQTTNDGDGVVRYDRLANRWVISQFSVNGGNGPFWQCIAVSTSPDPTGSYARYAFQFTAMNDYPKIALWPDAYYISFNMFPDLKFAGSKVCAFDRAKMLAGQAATIQCFDTTDQYGGLLVADMDGATPPAAGTPAYVVSLGIANNDLAFWKMHVDFATPANSTFLGPSAITVETYTAMCAGQQSCVVQPGVFAQKLDGLDDRLMNRVVYRNFGDHDAVLLSHAVQRAGGGGGMRWYELRNMSSTPQVFQQGTYAPDGAFRWMGSAAFDRAGDIAMGFAISSSTLKPGISYTARAPGDAPGTMGQGEAVLVAGGGTQSFGLSRYGDYSSLNIDPSDDCTFWYTMEYMKTSGSFSWNTRIGSFTLPGCAGGGGDTTPPSTAITSPAPNTQLAGVTTLTASASDNVGVTKVELLVDAKVVATVTGAPYSATWDSRTVADGAHSVTSKAYDAAGNGGSSVAVAVTVKNGGGTDTTPPTTSITGPGAGAILAGTATITASASDNVGVARVEFYAGATLISTDSASPFSASWDTTKVADGSYSLTSKAYDAAGLSGTSAAVAVTVKNGGTTATELVVNGGFEGGNLTGWTVKGRAAATTAHHASGSYSARVGSTLAYSGDSSITQSVLVPQTGSTSFTFRYLLRCKNDNHDYDQQQAFVLDATGRVLATVLDVCAYTTSWTGATLDLTPYAGQTVQIQFKDHDDGYADDPTWFYVDKVSVLNRK